MYIVSSTNTVTRTFRVGDYEYIERFRNLSLLCPVGMSLSMSLQTCRHNFLDKVEVCMGAVKSHTWKELVEQAEIAEKSAKIVLVLHLQVENQQQSL